MYLIKPYIKKVNVGTKPLELIEPDEVELLLEEYGKVCYQAESPTSSSLFLKKRVEEGHESLIEHISITAIIITNRSVSHELVRHRIASYSQESQRYVAYNKKGIAFIIPSWIDTIEEGKYDKYKIDNNHPNDMWFDRMISSEIAYNAFLEKGWKPEEARDILPNATKTEIVSTFNIREWRHVFRLRASKKAYSEIRRIFIPLLLYFKEKMPALFDDIKYDEKFPTDKYATLYSRNSIDKIDSQQQYCDCEASKVNNCSCIKKNL